MRRALIAYACRGFEVESYLGKAMAAIHRVADSDTGPYRARSSDPAATTKPFYRYWGDPVASRSARRDQHKTTPYRMLKDVLKYQELLVTDGVLTPEDREAALRRLREELETPASALQIIRDLRALEMVTPARRDEVVSVIHGIGRFQRSRREPTPLGPLPLRLLLPVVCRADAAGDDEFRELVVGALPVRDAAQAKDANEPPSFGTQTVWDLDMLDLVTRGLLLHHLAATRTVGEALSRTTKDLGSPGRGGVTSRVGIAAVDLLLDLDRGPEAVALHQSLELRDVDEQARLTSRIVRYLLVTEGVGDRAKAALEFAGEVEDARELSWLRNLVASSSTPSGEIPVELFNYWCRRCLGATLGDWSALEAAELLIWAYTQSGRHGAGRELAKDTLDNLHDHPATPADQRRLDELRRYAEPEALERANRKRGEGRGLRPFAVAEDHHIAEQLRNLQHALAMRPGHLSWSVQRDLWALSAVSRPMNRD